MNNPFLLNRPGRLNQVHHGNQRVQCRRTGRQSRPERFVSGRVWRPVLEQNCAFQKELGLAFCFPGIHVNSRALLNAVTLGLLILFGSTVVSGDEAVPQRPAADPSKSFFEQGLLAEPQRPVEDTSKSFFQQRLLGGQVSIKPKSAYPWSVQNGWDAERVFADPKVVRLCEAIESQDFTKVQALVDVGVDVNSVGIGGMTPLMWCMPADKGGVFECLLRNGADPNKFLTMDFAGKGGRESECVTLQSALLLDAEGFALVLENRGDCHIERRPQGGVPVVPNYRGGTPLESALGGVAKDSITKVRLLQAKGVDITQTLRGTPAPMLAVFGGHFDVALMMLDQGADCKLFDRENFRLAHRIAQCSPGEVKPTFDRFGWDRLSEVDRYRVLQIVKHLEKHNESLEEATTEMIAFQRIVKASGMEAGNKMMSDLRNAREARSERP